eukprot:264749-Prorocentrum_minimum.AAC.1
MPIAHRSSASPAATSPPSPSASPRSKVRILEPTTNKLIEASRSTGIANATAAECAVDRRVLSGRGESDWSVVRLLLHRQKSKGDRLGRRTGSPREVRERLCDELAKELGLPSIRVLE